MATVNVAQPICHAPREASSATQDLMPSRYSIGVQVLSMAAFTLAFVGWLNETWLFWFENPIWLNRYTEYCIILGFGIWRIIAEKNAYTRRRLIILVAMVTVFWWLIPWLYPFYEPYVGFLWAQPVFPSLHVPGTITFFLVLAAVFLFGRRIICGFNCPCVGIRETVGFAFRDRTPRSNWTWALRHTKWFFFIYYVGIMVVTQYPPNSWTVSFVGGFYLIVAMTYFGSFFIAPIVGNRFYCRYLCPYGATFGLLNHAGFYGINMDRDRCNDCQRCEQVCDMGIPVWKQGKLAGRVTAIEDCMGCARCVVACPTDALEITDVRNFFNKSLVQNASHLLKRDPLKDEGRQLADYRDPSERVLDWAEISTQPSLSMIQQQASRCLDCGLPGCSNACPLNNRIPEWLEQVALGNIQQAAEIAHTTSNMPEICGTLCPQHRLCEGSCTKANEPGGAVTIGAIERYLVNEALDNQWQLLYKIKNNAKCIAVVGAGPAGLACADELNKAGCEVTVFDRNEQVGGLMATGVPPFKLDKATLTRRHKMLEQQGVKFQLGVDMNESRLQKLIASYDAIFLATGAQTSRDLKLPGQHLKGVTDALSYLQQVNTTKDVNALTGKHVLVIGGGDSAIDCARSALRQNAEQVTIAYRGNEQAMRATPKEKQAAWEEGVRLRLEYAPVEVIGNDCVTGVRFDKVVSGQETIDCDLVIFAVGQVNKPQSWMEQLNIKTDRQGVIIIDDNGRTSNSKFYAGGDNTNGPDLVVTAVASGRSAAEGILKRFRPHEKIIRAVYPESA
ncbi:MAG: FAD-dependent oxidoreductase [Gammaproteobacteria bacterium]|nr:FAD-dependent oxidoreductase [Gammaproteobacteria bacterium]